MATVDLVGISSRNPLAGIDSDALVIGAYSGDSAGSALELEPGTNELAAAFDGDLVAIAVSLGATGALGEVTTIATLGRLATPLLVIIGLGKRDPQDPTNITAPADDASRIELLRRAAGAAVRELAGRERVTLALCSSRVGEDNDVARGEVLAVAEGALSASYDFTAMKRTLPDDYRAPVSRISIAAPGSLIEGAEPPGLATELAAELRRREIVAATVNQTRDWVNTPPNLLRPNDLADAAAKAATQVGLNVEVLDEDALRAGGYGGLLAVGGGSDSPPRLVRIAYQPAGAQRSIALVGKGITFDTGGISIKRGVGMMDMKTDMAGAASVIATMLAIAELAPPVTVIGYAALAENMPSGSAYRPGDVITLYGGQTIEIVNTDAEGRLVLGDAIGRACEDNPDYLIEASTLTGAQIVALGARTAGVMGTPEVCELIQSAGATVGEAVWPMPLPADVRGYLDSPIADFGQGSPSFDRTGHMLQGGHFLAECIADGIPWAHLDIAGPAYNAGKASGYLPAGATGVPIRTLIEVVERIGRG